MIKYLHTAKITINDSKVLTLQSAYDPDGIDFDFSVKRKRFQINAEIGLTLYNIGRDTFKELNRKQGGDNFYNNASIKCEAGYRGNNKLIFSGTVFKVTPQASPGEKVTSVTVSNYSDKLTFSYVARTYGKPPRASRVIQDYANEIGVSANLLNLAPGDDKATKASSFQGTMANLLTSLSSENPNIVCEFYNDTVIVSSLSYRGPKVPVEVLNSSTGMIMTPTITDENLIQVNALFNPDYAINQFIRVESSEFEQPVVSGHIWTMAHNFTSAAATSMIEILPEGQDAPRSNLGVAP